MHEFYGVFGMASNESGHAAKQETPDAFLSMRTKDDQFRTPHCETPPAGTFASRYRAIKLCT